MKLKIRILSLILCLCVMTVSLTSCFSYIYVASGISDILERQSESLKENVQTGAPQSPETAILPVLERYEYSLSQGDYQTFLDKLSRFEELLMIGTDSAAIGAAEKEMEEHYYFISTQSKIAYLLYSIDLSDEKASDEYLFSSGMATDAYAEYLSVCRRIYESDSPYKDAYFSDWSEESIAEMIGYDPQIAEYEKRIDEIEVEYRALSETDFDREVCRLFMELVECNNAIAQLQGYDNYVVYAYEKSYGRDYAPQDVEQLRTLVKETLVSRVTDFYMQFFSLYEDMSIKEQRTVSSILRGNFAELESNELEHYLEALPESSGKTMRSLFTDQNLVLANGKDAQEGAFTGYLQYYNVPICYFGPSYQDVYTVVHELGHYYAFSQKSGGSVQLDLAELQSQGNEFLFSAFLRQEDLDDDVYAAVAAYQAFGMLLSIISCCIIDEFEQYVYTNEIEDPTTQLDQIMETICEPYNQEGLVDEFLGMTDYWKQVTIESPLYYISYAVSGIASLELYSYAMENFDAAALMYCALVENVDGSKAYQQILESAGLGSPFDVATYERIVGLLPVRG